MQQVNGYIIQGLHKCYKIPSGLESSLHSTIVQGKRPSTTLWEELSVKLSLGQVGTKNAESLKRRGESTKGGTAVERCNFRNNRRFSEQTLVVK